MSNETNDTERVESRIRGAYAGLAPEPGVEVDLERALAVAPQEASPSPMATWTRRLAIPLAASLLVAGAWWWGTHRAGGTGGTGGEESHAGPKESPAPSLEVLLRADGSIRFHSPQSVSVVSPKGTEPFEATGATLEFKGDDRGAPASDVIRAVLVGTTSHATRREDGTSSIVLFLQAEPTVPWPRVAEVLMVAADPDVRISDIRYASPSAAHISVAQPLPVDAGLGPRERVAYRVVLTVDAKTDAATIAASGVTVRLALPSKEPDSAKWTMFVEGTTPPPGDSRAALARERAEFLDRLVARARAAIENDHATVAEVSTPATTLVPIKTPTGHDSGAFVYSFVPYAAVWDVLSALKTAGFGDVQFAGPGGRKPLQPAAPTAAAAPTAPGSPGGAAPAKAASPAALDVLDEKRIRGAHFEDATLAQVVTYLSTVTGLNFVVSPKATACSIKVSIPTLDDVSARQVLDVVTVANGLRWETADFGVVRILEASEATGAGR